MRFFYKNIYVFPLILFTLFFAFLICIHSLNCFYLIKENWLKEVNANKNLAYIIESELNSIPSDKIEELLKKYAYIFSIQRKIDLNKKSDLYIVDEKNKILHLFPKSIPSNLENHLNNITDRNFKWCFLEIKNDLYILKKVKGTKNYNYIVLKMLYIERGDFCFSVYYDDFIYKNSIFSGFSSFNVIFLFLLYLFGSALIIFSLNKFNKKSRETILEINEKNQERYLILHNEIETLSEKYYGSMESEKLCRSFIIKDSKSNIVEISRIYPLFKELFKEEDVKNEETKLKGFFIHDIMTGRSRDMESILNEVIEIHKYNMESKNIKIKLISKIKSTEIYRGPYKIICSILHLIMDVFLKNNSTINVFLYKKNKDIKIVFEWSMVVEVDCIKASLKKSLDLVGIKMTTRNDKIELIFSAISSHVKRYGEVDLCSNIVKLPPRR